MPDVNERETCARPTAFEVMAAMSKADRDIRLATLDNVLRVQKVRAGTQVTIGVAGDVVAAILNGRLIGALYLCDARQYAETERELIAKAGK
jgi:hypothetical protein